MCILYAAKASYIFVILVVPDSYTIYQSNQYDSNFQCLQDDHCRAISPTDDSKRSSGEQRLLTCEGPNSTLFDGIAGRDTLDNVFNFEQTDFSQHYTWQQAITPRPDIEMIFVVPLVELSSVTLNFFSQGEGARVNIPHVSICFSSNLNFSTCNNITFLAGLSATGNGVVERQMTSPVNVTSVTYLRIIFQYDGINDDEFIFLSEIRIAEILQGSYIFVI